MDLIEQQFDAFLEKGCPPYNYERTLMHNYFGRICSILANGNPPPYEIEIQPSSLCNSGCSHCFARGYPKTENLLDTRENMQHILDQVFSFTQDGFDIERIKFCGTTGEPLMNDQILYAIDRAYNEKKFIRLFTNGIRLGENENNDDYLRTIAKINSLNISLDAGTTETLHKIKPGSKDVSLESILHASARLKQLSDMDLTISYVISNENYAEILEAVRKYRDVCDRVRFRIDLTDRTVSQHHDGEIIHSLDVAKDYETDRFKVVPVHTEEEISQYDSEYFSSRDSGLKCFTSRFWTCIGSDGCLYPCGHIVSPEVENFGSLLQKDFPSIWAGRKELIDKLPLKKCSVCSPFSLRTNSFMTFLADVPLDRLKSLHGKYVG